MGLLRMLFGPSNKTKEATAKADALIESIDKHEEDRKQMVEELNGDTEECHRVQEEAIDTLTTANETLALELQKKRRETTEIRKQA